uniref:Kazal-like domain-containing protein n=1 Tax=Phasianus colchicus TaxID=9054 RepID=A0A669PRE9_PHACC
MYCTIPAPSLSSSLTSAYGQCWGKPRAGGSPGIALLIDLLLRGDCSACAVPRNFCSQEYIPHCGSDGVTYASKCLFCNTICSSFKLSLYHVFEC